jgi:glycerophosphoryl diester phosphodiesterase
MRFNASLVGVAVVAGRAAATPCPPTHQPITRIDLGPRPFFLVDNMDRGALKKELTKCANSDEPWRSSAWSIGHRGGGTLFMPEHTVQSNLAGARMGAGVLECDVGFTKDRQLVCRHSQCDLHYTTDILLFPELAAKCTKPFTPYDEETGEAASAVCCTSDITLDEYYTLQGKMEGQNTTAVNVEDYQHGTPAWRTDLMQPGTLMSLQDHIALTESLGLLHTAELKTPPADVEMPFEGEYSQADFAQQLVDEYKKAGVDPKDLFLQSFLYDDMLYWLENEPEFAEQAMYLDETGETPETFPGAVQNLTRYVEDGVKYIAPPLQYLVEAQDGKIVPSIYAETAMELGLKIVPWTMERSGPLALVQENEDYYFSTYADAVNNDGDIFNLLDVLYRQIGIDAIFSDWSATATFYANCLNIKLAE